MADSQCIHRLGAQTHRLPPGAEDLVSHWLLRCGGRPLPWRANLATHELRAWRLHLALVEIREGDAYLIVQSGVELIRRFGREATGAYIDTLAPDIGRHLRMILKTAVRGLGAVVAHSAVPLGHSTAWFNDVALPLAHPAGDVGAILFCSYPTR